MRFAGTRLWVGASVLALALALLTIWAPHAADSSSTTILITAIYCDTYLPGEPDEAFRLTNISGSPIDLTGWTVSDGEGTINLSDTLASGASIWISEEADDFALEFGFAPDYEYGADTDPAVPNLATSDDFALENRGEELVLRDSGASIIDSVVYAEGDPAGTEWSGAGIYPYGGDSVGTEGAAAQEGEIEGFGLEGQVLYRKLDQATGLPVPDTDTAADWAQATDDPINGKKVMYPGWDLERYFFPEAFTEAATVTYAVAPDNIYEAVLSQINQATSSLYYAGYIFENTLLAEAIVARMAVNPAMSVSILLEGAPVGGITDQQKWICQQIEDAGGQVYFMYNDEAADVHDRYNNQQGKWMIIDEEVLLTGSVDIDFSSMPADDKSDGTEGNRGVWLITDAPSAVSHALDLFQHDLDPDHHRDLVRWTASDPTYGAPLPGFVPDYDSGGGAYPVPFPTALTTSGTLPFELVQSPENSLRDGDSLLGMVDSAGSSDTVLVEQLSEQTFWGPATSNPTDDPNPRLEAYIAAARRGASVRILLDSVHDDPTDVRGNTSTCTYVNAIAAAESLDLRCKLANPAGTGIHNKMVLVQAGGQAYVHTGSINGSEGSSKNNRELAVQVQSDVAYEYLAGVFWHDYPADAEFSVYLPLFVRDYPAPPSSGSWTGEVTNMFHNCGLTRLFGYTLDRNGDLLGDVWVRYWADGWEGAWARSLWYDFGAGTSWRGDEGNWDGVLDTRPRGVTWHVCIVPAQGSWDCISNQLDVTTSLDCINEYQVYHITFRQD